MTAWVTRHAYSVGDRATWEGVALVCTRNHYAGDAATHPWDPGNGWCVEKAATLWTPNGPIEVERLGNLRKQLSGGHHLRLFALIMEVAGDA